MTFETKEEVLERILAKDKPTCPHCRNEMTLWEVPNIAVGDGLGWGTPYLYICFNDDCSLYKDGWESIKEQFAHNASHRCMCYPGTETFECIPVFSPEGEKGKIMDEEVLMEQEARKEAIKRGFSILADCDNSKDWVEVLKLLVDPTEPARVRAKAAEMLGDIGDLDTLEPLRNTKFGNEIIMQHVDGAIKKIHDRHFTRECPFCAEIIKKRAKICKHCSRDLTAG